VANVFDFRPGRSVKNVNPQALGEWLERLRSKSGGQLTPDIVVEAAADPDSPGHAGFEWDDTAAARQHRLAQARRLIVSVRVINPPTARPIVAFVSVRTPEHGRNYVPTVEAMSDEEMKTRVLAEVRVFIESMERRYAHFAEAAALLAGLKKNVG
jgi:hypothetical protein